MYISGIEIKNFRSFDNINIEFHECVNVLIGHNNSGKSNLLRALAIIFDGSVRKQLSVEDFNNSLTIESLKIEFWTKEEFEKVISLIYKEVYYQHFLFVSLWFLLMTGIRIGEATAIQWEDVDFESGVLTINKNLYYKNQSNYKFVEPKTKASVRHIVLDECTLNILSE